MTPGLSAALIPSQRRLVTIGWLTYASFYLGRLNLSPALPSIAADLNIGLGRVGILGTVFFICYAIGQLINGQLGTLFSPRLVIFVGLLLIALSNIVFALQNSLLLLAVFWGINGFAQAAGWGPMLRILSSKLNISQIRSVSTLFSISFQIGTAVAWGLAGLLLLSGTWQAAFWVPGVFLLVVAILWYFSGINAENIEQTTPQFRLSDVMADIRQLLPMLLAAAFVGFIYIGILLWLPTFIQEWDFIPPGLTKVLTAIVPLVGIPGMLLAGYLLTKQANVLRTILLFLIALIISLLLSYLTTTLVQLIAVLMIVMIASGLAGLLLSSVPMLLTSKARVSSAGGLLTAVWSFAGGLSGTVIGTVAETAGWSSVFLLWMGFAVAAAIAVWAAQRTIPHTH